MVFGLNEKYLLNLFLQAHHGSPKIVEEEYGSYVNWRQDHNLDLIRRDILLNKLKGPLDFPHGKKILKATPMLLLAFNGLEDSGLPIISSSYGYDKSLYKGILKEDYVLFMLYIVEYKSLVLEQLVHQSKDKSLHNIPKEALPKAFGGISKVSFVFDLSSHGPFPAQHAPRRMTDPILPSTADPTQLTLVPPGTTFEPVSILRRQSSDSTTVRTQSNDSSVFVTVNEIEKKKVHKIFSKKAIFRFMGFSPKVTTKSERNVNDGVQPECNHSVTPSTFQCSGENSPEELQKVVTVALKYKKRLQFSLSTKQMDC